jgi:hypothetical protein
MERMQVIGEDGEVYEIEGDVMGEDVMGDDDDDEYDVVGARRSRRRRRARGGVMKLRKPKWRQNQIAPGVIAPDQGLVPLTLGGKTNNGVFDVNNASITFEGQLQKPFRGERLLVSTVRTGVTAVGRLIAQLFIGTDLQQGDIQGFDLEQVGDPQAFGVRLTMKPAQPGVFISLPVSLNVPVTGADTIATTVTLLGRIVQ